MGMTRSHAHDGRTRHRASEQLSPPKRVPAYSASRINTKGRTDERERDDVPQPTPLCFARTRVRCRRSIRAQGRLRGGGSAHNFTERRCNSEQRWMHHCPPFKTKSRSDRECMLAAFDMPQRGRTATEVFSVLRLPPPRNVM